MLTSQIHIKNTATISIIYMHTHFQSFSRQRREELTSAECHQDIAEELTSAWADQAHHINTSRRRMQLGQTKPIASKLKEGRRSPSSHIRSHGQTKPIHQPSGEQTPSHQWNLRNGDCTPYAQAHHCTNHTSSSTSSMASFIQGLFFVYVFIFYLYILLFYVYMAEQHLLILKVEIDHHDIVEYIDASLYFTPCFWHFILHVCIMTSSSRTFTTTISS